MTPSLFGWGPLRAVEGLERFVSMIVFLIVVKMHLLLCTEALLSAPYPVSCPYPEVCPFLKHSMAGSCPQSTASWPNAGN